MRLELYRVFFMKAALWGIASLLLVIGLPGVFGFEAYFVGVHNEVAFASMVEHFQNCSPEGLKRVVFYGRLNDHLAGISYFGSGHAYVWGLDYWPVKWIERVLVHEVLEVQCFYGCRVESHNLTSVSSSWSLMKCLGVS